MGRMLGDRREGAGGQVSWDAVAVCQAADEGGRDYGGSLSRNISNKINVNEFKTPSYILFFVGEDVTVILIAVIHLGMCHEGSKPRHSLVINGRGNANASTRVFVAHQPPADREFRILKNPQTGQLRGFPRHSQVVILWKSHRDTTGWKAPARGFGPVLSLSTGRPSESSEPKARPRGACSPARGLGLWTFPSPASSVPSKASR